MSDKINHFSLIASTTLVRIICLEPADRELGIEIGDIFMIVGTYRGFPFGVPIESKCDISSLDRMGDYTGIVMFADQYEVLDNDK